jgi:hypothetical protein
VTHNNSEKWISIKMDGSHQKKNKIGITVLDGNGLKVNKNGLTIKIKTEMVNSVGKNSATKEEANSI